MRITLKTFLAVLMMLALVSTSASAQGGDRSGTAGAEQLLVPVGAEGIALGSSFSAAMTGVNAIYYNPAGLSATSQNAEALFSYTNSFGDFGTNYLAVGAKFGDFGNLALTVKSFSLGDIEVTNERNPDGTGATFAPQFLALGLTYSRALTDRIRVGFTGYFLSESFDRASASNFVFDVGVQYQGLGGVRGLSMGVTLRHLGGNMTYDGPGLYRPVDELDSKRDAQLLKIQAAGFSMPTSLELALSYGMTFEEKHMLSFGGAFENNNFMTDQFRLGVEYNFTDMLFVRGSYAVAGTDIQDNFGESAYIYGPAFGLGLHFRPGGMLVGFDYAYRMNDILDGSHVFDLLLGF